MSIDLSSREIQVRDLICKGLSNKEMGRTLGLSARTIEDHRRSLMMKYRVANVVMLVRAVYKLDEVTTA